MTEYHCEECGAAVTEDATECPECGVVFSSDVEAEATTGEVITGGIIILALLAVVIGGGWWAYTAIWGGDEPKAEAPPAVVQQTSQPKPETSAPPIPNQKQDRNLVGELFRFENMIFTYTDMIIPSLKSVVDKMKEYDAGLISDPADLTTRIEEAQENVRTAASSVTGVEIPKDLPLHIEIALKKYRKLIIEATEIKGKMLQIYKQVISDPDAEGGDVHALSRIIQRKQAEAVAAMEEAVAAARAWARSH